MRTQRSRYSWRCNPNLSIRGSNPISGLSPCLLCLFLIFLFLSLSLNWRWGKKKIAWSSCWDWLVIHHFYFKRHNWALKKEDSPRSITFYRPPGTTTHFHLCCESLQNVCCHWWRFFRICCCTHVSLNVSLSCCALSSQVHFMFLLFSTMHNFMTQDLWKRSEKQQVC